MDNGGMGTKKPAPDETRAGLLIINQPRHNPDIYPSKLRLNRHFGKPTKGAPCQVIRRWFSGKCLKNVEKERYFFTGYGEAASRFELEVKVLQTSALPLGYAA